MRGGRCVHEEQVGCLCGVYGWVDVEEELNMHEKGTSLESGMCWPSGDKANAWAVWEWINI